jgi:hypothetical protein
LQTTSFQVSSYSTTQKNNCIKQKIACRGSGNPGLKSDQIPEGLLQ